MSWVEYKVDRAALGDRQRHQVCMGDPWKQGLYKMQVHNNHCCLYVPQVSGSIKNPHNNNNPWLPISDLIIQIGHFFEPKSTNIFSLPELKAQDEVLWSLTIHRPFSVRLSTPLNFSSGTPGPIFFKFHVEPSFNGRLKICPNGQGPLIKMATMPIYGKDT